MQEPNNTKKPGIPGAPAPGGPGPMMKQTRHIQSRDSYPMDITAYKNEWKYLDDIGCWTLEDIVYCSSPASIDYQHLILYVPAEYMSPDGTVNENGTRGPYTSSTAPIVVQANVMGYSQAQAAKYDPEHLDHDLKEALTLIRSGMVYASVSVRGIETRNESGAWIGKAPQGLVDIKAAIRFIRANRKSLPGDAEKMFCIGISAGGALCTLTAVTGNNERFLPYLEKIGACMGESDEIYGAQIYCPITDLDHADAAYEWMFMDTTLCHGFGGAKTEMSPFSAALSKKLKGYYPKYINSLGLKDSEGNPLVLSEEGQGGSLYELVMAELEKSVNVYAEKLLDGKVKLSCSLEDYVRGNYTETDFGPGGMRTKPGMDKSAWLSVSGNGIHITGSLRDLQEEFVPRMKACPGFDSLELGQHETRLFGDLDRDAGHFDPVLADVIESLQNEFPEEAAKYLPEIREQAEAADLKQRRYLMNPLNFIGTEEKSDMAKHYRIRLGAKDPHTSFTVALIIAVKLANAGFDTDFAYIWERGHGGADYEGELDSWIRSLT